MSIDKIFIPWETSYSVGIFEIDKQHKRLVKLINDLYNAFMSRTHKEKLKEIIDELTKYTIYHFSNEERYFHDFNFPEKEEHIKQHNKFVAQVQQFQDDFKKDSSALTFKVLTFLQRWLVEHITGTDRKYIELFKINGVK